MKISLILPVKVQRGKKDGKSAEEKGKKKTFKAEFESSKKFHDKKKKSTPEAVVFELPLKPVLVNHEDRKSKSKSVALKVGSKTKNDKKVDEKVREHKSQSDEPLKRGKDSATHFVRSKEDAFEIIATKSKTERTKQNVQCKSLNVNEEKNENSEFKTSFNPKRKMKFENVKKLSHAPVEKINFMKGKTSIVNANSKTIDNKKNDQEKWKFDLEKTRYVSHGNENFHPNSQRVTKSISNVQISTPIGAVFTAVEKKKNGDAKPSNKSNDKGVKTDLMDKIKTHFEFFKEETVRIPKGENSNNAVRPVQKSSRFENVILKISREKGTQEKLTLTKMVTHEFKTASTNFKDYAFLPQTKRENTVKPAQNVETKGAEVHRVAKQILVAVSKALENQKPPLKIELHLNPPELGKITIKIVEKGGKTSFIMNTQNVRAHELMKMALPIMNMQLSQLNFNVVEIQLNGQQWTGGESGNHRKRGEHNAEREKDKRNFSEEFKKFGKGEV